MSTKNWIRVVGMAGILAWPGVETARYFVAVNQREAAVQRQQQVTSLLAQARTTHLARQQKTETSVPVSNPGSSLPKTPSSL